MGMPKNTFLVEVESQREVSSKRKGTAVFLLKCGHAAVGMASENSDGLLKRKHCESCARERDAKLAEELRVKQATAAPAPWTPNVVRSLPALQNPAFNESFFAQHLAAEFGRQVAAALKGFAPAALESAASPQVRRERPPPPINMDIATCPKCGVEGFISETFGQAGHTRKDGTISYTPQKICTKCRIETLTAARNRKTAVS
jgi:hypothetical protein